MFLMFFLRGLNRNRFIRLTDAAKFSTAQNITRSLGESWTSCNYNL